MSTFSRKSPARFDFHLANIRDYKAGILQQQTPAIYHQLRNLRSAAARASDFSFSPDSAIEYADLATRLAVYLQKT